MSTEKCFCHIADRNGNKYTVKDATARKELEALRQGLEALKTPATPVWSATYDPNKPIKAIKLVTEFGEETGYTVYLWGTDFFAGAGEEYADIDYEPVVALDILGKGEIIGVHGNASNPFLINIIKVDPIKRRAYGVSCFEHNTTNFYKYVIPIEEFLQ